MSGSTLGHLFCVTNFGESHGPAIGCVIDGCPPGLALSEADIQPDLDRRRPGTSRHVTQRNEPDAVEILSGVYEGFTTGTPICLLIRNTDQRSKDYGNILQTFRPGHADYTYWHKYGRRDPRGGGRSSARMTAPMVGAGAVAKKWLREHHGVTFSGHLSQLGEIAIPFESLAHVPDNPFFAANASDIARLESYMDDLRKAGNSCGARIDVAAHGVPVGWGEPLFDKLDADIAHAMMGINAVKGVEIGAGFHSVSQRGTTHGDELTPEGFVGNNAPVACWVVSPPDRTSPCRSRSSPPVRSAARVSRSTCPASRPPSRPSVGTDPCVGIRATADRRSDAGAGADGPCPAAPRAMRRCPHHQRADRGPASLPAEPRRLMRLISSLVTRLFDSLSLIR